MVVWENPSNPAVTENFRTNLASVLESEKTGILYSIYRSIHAMKIQQRKCYMLFVTADLHCMLIIRLPSGFYSNLIYTATDRPRGSVPLHCKVQTLE